MQKQWMKDVQIITDHLSASVWALSGLHVDLKSIENVCESAMFATHLISDWIGCHQSLLIALCVDRAKSCCCSCLRSVSLFPIALFFQFWHAEAHLTLDVVLSRCTRPSRPPVLRSMCSGYAALFFFSRFVSVSRPLPAQIVSDRRCEAVPGRPSPPSHSYTTRCGRTAYHPMNWHSLVEWLHICSQQFTDLWISVFKILFFRKTVLTIACSDLRD